MATSPLDPPQGSPETPAGTFPHVRPNTAQVPPGTAPDPATHPVPPGTLAGPDPRPVPEPRPVPRPSGQRGGRFGELPELAGKGFIPLGLFARLPLAMLTVGVLTLVTAVSRSYALGGFAAGAVGAGSAVGAPLLGYLADRFGQKAVLLVAAVANALALAAVVVLSYRPGAFAPGAVAWVLATAFLSGATSPQVGPLARVRWMSLTGRFAPARRSAVLETALSYESTADELTFVMGPALVGILAGLVTPWLPLALAAVLTLILVSLFAVHPTEAAVVRHVRAAKGAAAPAAGKISWIKVALPVLGMVSMGTFFGATQTSLIAFTGSFGAPELGGLLYAVMGLSSAGAALSVAYWPSAFGQSWRWLAIAALMAALSVLLLLPTSVPAMVGVLLLLGIPVGPTMVTIFGIGGMVAPRRWLGTVMTALASGIVAGTAVGSSIAGTLAQSAGSTAAFGVSIAASCVLVLLGALTAFLVRRRTQRSSGRPPTGG